MIEDPFADRRPTMPKDLPRILEEAAGRQWGWQCEDCPHFADTEDDALAHCDERGHSLARSPRPVVT